MQKADFPQGARCLPTCRLPHQADKSNPATNADDGSSSRELPEGEMRWCSGMVNERLRRLGCQFSGAALQWRICRPRPSPLFPKAVRSIRNPFFLEGTFMVRKVSKTF